MVKPMRQSSKKIKKHISIHYIKYLMKIKRVSDLKLSKYLDRPIEDVRILINRNSGSCIKFGEPRWEKTPNEKLEVIRWLETFQIGYINAYK